MVFLFGILYCWVQSFISYKMKSCGLITNTLLFLRLTLTIIVSIFFISCATATSFVFKDWIHHRVNGTNIPHRWDHKDKNYVQHIVGDVSEWLMALTLLGFFFTFFGEFRFVKMKIVVSRRTQNPVPLATGTGSDDGLYTSLYVWVHQYSFSRRTLNICCCTCLDLQHFSSRLAHKCQFIYKLLTYKLKKAHTKVSQANQCKLKICIDLCLQLPLWKQVGFGTCSKLPVSCKSRENNI